MQMSYKSKGVIVLLTEVDECTIVHHMKPKCGWTMSVRANLMSLIS